MTTAHSLLGASSAHRWLNCPGSFRLSETAPHRPSSIYAATGTLAHQMIEDGVVLGHRYDQGGLGRNIVVEGHTVAVDQDLIDGVNMMLEYLANIEADKLTNWMDVEFRVDLYDYFPVPPPVTVFGTVDAAALTNKTLEVIDYKNGSGITVTPKENPQLMFYGAGALRHLPPIMRSQIERVKLTIVQPHASGVAPIRSWDIDVVDLLMWVDEVLVPGVMACNDTDPALVPGSWCRFCPVVAHCPKLALDAVTMAKQDFDDILPIDPAISLNNTDASVVAAWLEVAERVDLWISRVREFATDQLQRQIPIPGWGLVPTRATRKWLLPDDAIAGRLSELGYGKEAFETRLRSPAQMEKVLVRTRAGKKVWEQVAVPMIETRSSGVKLGRKSSSASEDFNDDGDQ